MGWDGSPGGRRYRAPTVLIKKSYKEHVLVMQGLSLSMFITIYRYCVQNGCEENIGPTLLAPQSGALISTAKRCS